MEDDWWTAAILYLKVTTQGQHSILEARAAAPVVECSYICSMSNVHILCKSEKKRSDLMLSTDEVFILCKCRWQDQGELYIRMFVIWRTCGVTHKFCCAGNNDKHSCIYMYMSCFQQNIMWHIRQCI